MFRLFKNKKNKPDPILEALEKQDKMLEELLIKLGYTDDDLERIEQKSKMKVIKKDED